VSTDRDVDRVVRSWMDEGVTVLPDRVLDAVLDQIPSTPQRRAFGLAQRFKDMNTYARFGFAAAVVVLAAVVGIGLYANSVGEGPPTPSSNPSSSSSPTPVANPLAGTWVAPVVTCAKQIATIEAAGFTAAQVRSVGMDPTCASGGSNQYTIVFDALPVAATIRGAVVYDRGATASTHVYRLASYTTFEFGGENPQLQGFEWCVTPHYAIAGDQLTIDMIDPACGTVEGPLLDQIALTGIFETSPFTRQP
jgi:hypothetical protein